MNLFNALYIFSNKYQQWSYAYIDQGIIYTDILARSNFTSLALLQPNACRGKNKLLKSINNYSPILIYYVDGNLIKTKEGKYVEMWRL